MTSASSYPSLGLLQFVILKIIQRAPVDASNAWVAEKVSRYRDVDENHINVIMWRLEERGFVECVKRKRNGSKGRPFKIYRITEEGRAAIEAGEELLRVRKDV